MKRTLLTGFIIFLVSFIGCKKNDSKPEDPGYPVFSINGTINGNYVFIQAGVDDYYMYSSCTTDTASLHSFIGTLKKANCSNCPQFSIKLNDNSSNKTVNSSHLDSILNEGFHYHHDSAKTVNYSLFHSVADLDMNVQSYYWDFGDGTTSNQKDPHHVFYGNGSYNVCHTITYTKGCSSTSCNEVKANFYDCYAFIDYNFSNDTFYFKGNATGNSISSPVDFDWNFGDPSTVKDTSHLQNPYYVFSAEGTYTVTMKTTDPGGCNYTVTRVIKTPKAGNICSAYFDYSKLLTPFIDYSVVSVTWTDEGGSVYSTNQVKQPVDSYFQILSVEDYYMNENAEPTKKINARIKCKLSNGSKAISMDNVSITFAVSYK